MLLNLEEIRTHIINKLNSQNNHNHNRNNELQEADICITFDTETTSLTLNDDGTPWIRKPDLSSEDNDKIERTKHKQSFVYIWMITIDYTTYHSRDMKDFEKFIELLNSFSDYQFHIAVHNLSFDFHFFQFNLSFIEEDCSVFAPKSHAVYKGTYKNVTFHCTYVLSGLSLEKALENINSPYKKKKGDLQYDLIRTPETPLDETEMGYCYADTEGLCYYWEFMKNKYGSYRNIPLTKTSIVRRECMDYQRKLYTPWFRQEVFKDIYSWFITDRELYEQLQQANVGGYTHGSWRNVRRHLKTKGTIRMFGHDKTSSYPATILLMQFPTSYKSIKHDRAKWWSKEILNNDCETKGWLFTVTMRDIESKNGGTWISESKCIHHENAVFENGKLWSADEIQISVNEWEWKTINRIYKFNDDYEVINMSSTKKKYLPLSIRLATLDYYKKKTKLKNKEGFEVEYNWSKTNVNSIFGVQDTDPVYGEIVYGQFDNPYGFTDMWHDVEHGYSDEKKIELTQKALDDARDKYDTSEMKLFSSPNIALLQWGMNVTTYCQYELVSLCDAIGWKNVIYCDTDSIKFVAFDEADLKRIQAIIAEFEAKQTERIYKAIDNMNAEIARCNKKIEHWNNHPISDKMGKYDTIQDVITWDDFAPEDIDGNKHPIGFFPLEDEYTDFKTLGAKRYLYTTKEGKTKLTVAGLSKEKGLEYLKKEAKDDLDEMYDLFDTDLTIPSEDSGKQTHTYHMPFDKPMTVTDYLGHTCIVQPTTGCCLTNQPFSLKMTDDYLTFLQEHQAYEGLTDKNIGEH